MTERVRVDMGKAVAHRFLVNEGAVFTYLFSARFWSVTSLILS